MVGLRDIVGDFDRHGDLLFHRVGMRDFDFHRHFDFFFDFHGVGLVDLDWHGARNDHMVRYFDFLFNFDRVGYFDFFDDRPDVFVLLVMMVSYQNTIICIIILFNKFVIFIRLNFSNLIANIN